jgi:hypothetical protein
MSSLHDFLKQLKIDQQSVNYHYIYYEKDTGIINKISSTHGETEQFEILKIESNQVSDLLHGFKKVSDFKVTFDITQKKLVLKELIKVSEQTATSSLVKLPLVEKTSADADFNLIQHDTQWEIFLSPETRKFIQTLPASNSFVHLSVTEFNEPHTLFETLKVNMSDLINNERVFLPMKNKFEEAVSIYTTKYFDTYSHGI